MCAYITYNFQTHYLKLTYFYLAFMVLSECHLPVTFPNILDPEHAQQNVGPGLYPNCS